MKQVDLYEKYREFVSDAYHSYIYRKPSDNIYKVVKEQRMETAHKRKEKLKIFKKDGKLNKCKDVLIYDGWDNDAVTKKRKKDSDTDRGRCEKQRILL
jgi:putative sterol carrier protein